MEMKKKSEASRNVAWRIKRVDSGEVQKKPYVWNKDPLLFCSVYTIQGKREHC